MIDSKNIDKIDVFFGVASTKLLNISFNRQCAIQISSKISCKIIMKNMDFVKLLI